MSVASGPVACFCFDCTQEAERHHEKIFTTIARDLADRDPMIWRTLASAVRDNELRHAKDIARQWRNFILGQVGAASQAVDTSILVVIDALDESGEARSREQILHMLAGNVDSLSTERNFRHTSAFSLLLVHLMISINHCTACNTFIMFP